MDSFERLAAMQYEYAVEDLWTGASYGNLETFARTSAKSNLYGLWCSLDDQHYCGKWHLAFYLAGERLQSQRTIFAPAHQTTVYPREDIIVSKTFFLPYGDGFKRAAYFVIRAANLSAERKQMGLVCDIEYPEFVWPDYVKTADLGQKRKTMASEIVDGNVVSRTVGREHEVRVVASSTELQAYFFGRRGASLTYSIDVEAGEQKEEAFVMLIGSSGPEELLAEIPRALDHETVFRRTCESVAEVLGRADLLVPDDVINRSVRWAKVNVIREEKLYPSGYGVTNDPPQDVLVVRDASWFSMGSDYITPEFSRGMLELILKWGVEEGGKLTEYIICCDEPPFKYDYGLNINDNTPLFIVAAHHYYALTRDAEFLQRVYPAVRDAALWILAQRRDGLVWCDSEESNVWGISGWRNIIPEYQISGAVTEINCECYMALRLAAALADRAGDTAIHRTLEEQAEALKQAINAKLVNEHTGLYLLNITRDGLRNESLSGDVIFPVITGVADDDTSRRILNRLAEPDFWTEFGVRTVPKGQHDYDPEFAVRLMGGIWPNLTAWVAMGNSRLCPERSVEAMRNIYRICEPPVPRNHKNVVPGEFPECLHGENFQSRGMALSPWVAPTYLWVAYDGLMGITPSAKGRIRISPNVPQSWGWAAVRNLVVGDRNHAFFLHEGKLYSSIECDTGYPLEVFDLNVTDQVRCNAYIIALRSGSRTLAFVASDVRQNVRLELDPLLTSGPRTLEFALEAGEARLIELRRDNRHGEGSRCTSQARRSSTGRRPDR